MNGAEDKSLFIHGRWIEECECGCGAKLQDASGEIERDGRTLVVFCDAPQRAATAAFLDAAAEAREKQRRVQLRRANRERAIDRSVYGERYRR